LLIITNVCIFGSVLKKLFSILVLLVYLPAVAGVGFSTHYLGGEAGDTKIFTTAKQSCCCGPVQEEENNCCSDQIKLVKLDNDQHHSDQRLLINPLSLELFTFAQKLVFNTTYSYTEIKSVQPDPPPLLAVSKRVLHCSFII